MRRMFQGLKKIKKIPINNIFWSNYNENLSNCDNKHKHTYIKKRKIQDIRNSNQNICIKLYGEKK